MTIMKTRLKAAQKGHGLLKRKADALQLRFRMILKKIVEVSILLILCALNIIAYYSILYFL